MAHSDRLKDLFIQDESQTRLYRPRHLPACTGPHKSSQSKNKTVAELCSERRFQRASFVLRYNHKHRKRTKAGGVASLSDKVVAFLLLAAPTRENAACERDGRSAPIVSPDLQRATNTEPDRERNCSENAPSCVINANASVKKGPLPQASASESRPNSYRGCGANRSRGRRGRLFARCERLWTLSSGYKSSIFSPHCIDGVVGVLGRSHALLN
ncbi:unnamed protein product [Leptosia nina]|uniref:Uncharacterized protein n=1 Tax=Leptosia nina TaxID=320188 RepID=A0AAV1JA47_9NEOP